MTNITDLPKLSAMHEALDFIAVVQILTGRGKDHRIIARSNPPSFKAAESAADVWAAAHAISGQPLFFEVDHDQVLIMANGQMFRKHIMTYACTL